FDKNDFENFERASLDIVLGSGPKVYSTELINWTTELINWTTRPISPVLVQFY
ncbi:26138_t:CDS:1, partial [Racocetra persica]